MSLAHWRDVWRRFSGRGAYPHELAFLLTLPLRRLIQPPAALVARLALAPDASVLELGPGPGWFSVEAARVLPRGRLVLFDLQREMLAKARRRLERAGAANAAFAQGDGALLPFRDDAFDVAFGVAVLGEVPDPAACVTELRRVLKRGGRLAVTETRGDPDAFSRESLEALVAPRGFALERVDLERAAFTAHFRAQ